jgi:PD-(D/E)XK endonuclease
MTKFHPRRQGDLGEAAAIQWLTWIGAGVALPLFHSPDFDLIADLNGLLVRVQVKSSSCFNEATGHYALQLATSGGNQSWTGVVKRFDPRRCDFLFAVVGDGRRWFIPSEEIEGSHSISLGGVKYSEFQVGRTAPLDIGERGSFKLSNPRGGAGVGEPGRPVKSVAQPEWVRFPPPPPSPPSGGDFRSRDNRLSAFGRTRMSANHQVTVPRSVSAASSVGPGDRFRVESDGAGRFVMTRIAEYMERHESQLMLPGDQAE